MLPTLSSTFEIGNKIRLGVVIAVDEIHFVKEFCAAGMVISSDAFLQVWTFVKIVLPSKM